jgi:hypothetical protein
MIVIEVLEVVTDKTRAKNAVLLTEQSLPLNP